MYAKNPDIPCVPLKWETNRDISCKVVPSALKELNKAQALNQNTMILASFSFAAQKSMKMKDRKKGKKLLRWYAINVADQCKEILSSLHLPIYLL